VGDGADTQPRPRIRSDIRSLFVGALGFVIAAILGSFLGTSPDIELPWQTAPRHKLVDLKPFVPDDWRVVRRVDVPVSGDETPSVVLHISESPDPTTGLAAGNILILAWDEEVPRWSVVFDARKVRQSYPSPDAALIDDFREPTDVKILSLKGEDGGTDIAFSTNLASGAGTPGQVVAVVRLAGDVARLAYTFDAFGSGTIRKIRRGRYENLVVRTMLYNGADAHCCPARNYEVELHGKTEYDYRFFEPVADDRPWSGAYVSHDETEVIVADVEPRSPADGQLLPGDRVLGVEGVPRSDVAESVLDTVSRKRAGESIVLEVDRGGQQRRVTLKLGSRLDAHHTGGLRPEQPQDLGWWLTMTDVGPRAELFRPDVAAAESGVQDGDVVRSVNDTPVGSVAEVNYELFRARGEIRLTVDRGGQEIRLTIPPGPRGEADPMVPLFDAITHL
jgi:hypothetical protein